LFDEKFYKLLSKEISDLKNFKNEFSTYSFKEFNIKIPCQPFQSRFLNQKELEFEQSKRLTSFSLPTEVYPFDLTLVEPKGILKDFKIL
jgi:hypothetical protein